MPFPKIYIDTMLLNWGDRLFHDPLRHVGAPRLSRVQIGSQAARVREQLARTLKHTPEVMVKITNRAASAQGMGAVRRHLRYISRNGKVELEDQDGQTIAGAAALHDLAVAVRRLGRTGDQHASRGVQHPAVDAAGYGPSGGTRCGARFCGARIRRWSRLRLRRA